MPELWGEDVVQGVVDKLLPPPKKRTIKDALKHWHELSNSYEAQYTPPQTSARDRLLKLSAATDPGYLPYSSKMTYAQYQAMKQGQLIEPASIGQLLIPLVAGEDKWNYTEGPQGWTNWQTRGIDTVLGRLDLKGLLDLGTSVATDPTMYAAPGGIQALKGTAKLATGLAKETARDAGVVAGQTLRDAGQFAGQATRGFGEDVLGKSTSQMETAAKRAAKTETVKLDKALADFERTQVPSKKQYITEGLADLKKDFKGIGSIDTKSAKETLAEDWERLYGQPPAGGTKEPWQMTREQLATLKQPKSIMGKYDLQGNPTPEGIKEDLLQRWDIRKWEEAGKPGGKAGWDLISYVDKYGLKEAEHRIVIEQALFEGKPVPPEVLADYPDLAAKIKVSETSPLPKPEGMPIRQIQGEPEVGLQKVMSLQDLSDKIDELQKPIDDEIERLMKSGMKFEDAIKTPSVNALEDARILYDQQFLQQLRVGMSEAIKTTGITDDALIGRILEKYGVYKEGGINSVFERMPSALRKTLPHDVYENPVAMLLMKDWAEKAGVDWSGVFESNLSGLTAKGQTELKSWFFQKAEDIQNAIMSATSGETPGPGKAGPMPTWAQRDIDLHAESLARGKKLLEEDKAHIVDVKAEAGVQKGLTANKKPPVPPPTPPPPTPTTPPPGLPRTPPPPGASGIVSPAASSAGRMIGDLQPVNELVSTMTNPDYLRKLGNRPGFKQFNQIFNPAAIADSPPKQYVIARAALREEVNNKMIGAFANLEALGTPDQVWGKLDDATRLTQGPLSGKPLEEVISFRKKYDSLLTPQQREWTDMFHQLNEAKLDFLERNGIDINKLTIEEGGEWVGRRIMGKVNPTTGEIDDMVSVGAGPSRPGAKASFEKHRIFDNVNDAIKAGYRPLRPEGTLFLNLKAAGNKVADKMTSDWLMERVPTRTTEVFNLPKASKLVASALKKEPIKPSNLVALRRDMPEYATRIEDALKIEDWPTRYNALLGIKKELKQIIPTSDAKLFWQVERLAQQRQAAQDGVTAMERALRGETLPTGTVKAIEKVAPMLKGQLREATRITLGDLVRAGEEASGYPKILPIASAYGKLPKLEAELAELEAAFATNPTDIALGKRVRQLRAKVGFTKYRIAQGEDIEFSKSPVSILNTEHKAAIQDVLNVLRGEPYETTTATDKRAVKYKGGLIKELRKQELDAIEQRKQIVERARTPMFEEATVQSPAFQGKIFTGPEAKETAEVLNKALNIQYGPIDDIIAAGNKINAIGRFFVLAGDASPFLIQLVMWPFRFPKQYGIAGKEFVKALFDEISLAKYLAKNADVIQDAHNIVLSKGGQTEYTEAFNRWGLLNPDRVPGKVLAPFQRGFESALDVAAIELRKSYAYMADTPQHAAELEQFINEVRGITSSARLGVAPQVRSAETLAWMAPRYNRAIAAILTDVARGGIRGDQARKALLATVAGFAAVGTAITLAKGEGWDGVMLHHDIRSPDFMTWEVFGQRIGPGSKMRSVLALTGRMENDPKATVDLATRFLRGNFSPIVGTGIDVISGKDFVGNPTRPSQDAGWGEGMLGLSKSVVAENLLPVWVQTTAMDGGNAGERLTRAGTEFMGGRASPMSTISSSYEWRWRDDFKVYDATPTDPKEAKGKKMLSRDNYRGKNPEIDAKLFIAGKVMALKTDEAVSYARKMIEEYGIDPTAIRGVKEAIEKKSYADQVSRDKDFIASITDKRATGQRYMTAGEWRSEIKRDFVSGDTPLQQKYYEAQDKLKGYENIFNRLAEKNKEGAYYYKELSKGGLPPVTQDSFRMNPQYIRFKADYDRARLEYRYYFPEVNALLKVWESPGIDLLTPQAQLIYNNYVKNIGQASQ